MEGRNHVSAVLGSAITVSLITLIGLTTAFGPEWVKQFLSGPASSWAQAVGGLAAVIAAIHVGRAQVDAVREQEALRRRELVESRVETIRGLLSTAIAVCEMVKSDQELNLPFPTRDHNVDFWMDCKTQLERLDPFLLPSARLVILVTGCPRQLSRLIEAHSAFRKGAGGANHRQVHQEFKKQLQESIDLLSEAFKECDLAVERLLA